MNILIFLLKSNAHELFWVHNKIKREQPKGHLTM